MHKLFPESWPFLAKIRQAHPQAEIFIVGGAVRDRLLGKPVKDFDFVVRGVRMEALATTLDAAGKVNIVGKRFGVIKFRPRGEDRFIDIALPRKEFSWAFTGGYRDFDIQSDPDLPIDADLSRRDFTVNAMAYNVISHELIDPFFGQKDLRARIIRTVGSAATRFQEDYSRMLRAVRFACRLGFELSEHTSAAIKKLGYHLNDTVGSDWVVAREVISQEFLKAFDADPVRCLNLLDELHLLAILFPEVKALQACKQTPPYHTEGSAYDHLLLALRSTTTDRYKQSFPETLPLISKLAILFHDLGKPAAATNKDGIVHFYGHETIGAKLVLEICQRLQLGSTPYYPFDPASLAWIVKEHLFAIRHQEKPASAVLLEETFFSPKHPGHSLMHCELADILASVPPNGKANTAPVDKLLAELSRLAPRGKLPAPLISGEDVIQWLAIKPGPNVAKALKAVREEQLQGRLTTAAQAKTFLTSHYA